LKIVAIDLSSNTGVAYFDTGQQDCLIDCFDFTLKHGTPMTLNRTAKIPNDQLSRKRKNPRTRIADKYDSSRHPGDFLVYVDNYIDQLISEIKARDWFGGLDYIIIEQTNKGRDRWKQKLLEWLHHELCKRFNYGYRFEICYIDTITWRRILSIKVTKEEKRSNRKIRAYNIEAKNDPDKKMIQGIVKIKDAAIDFCEKTFNLKMKKKDNNVAEAICLGYAWLKQEGKIK